MIIIHIISYCIQKIFCQDFVEPFRKQLPKHSKETLCTTHLCVSINILFSIMHFMLCVMMINDDHLYIYFLLCFINFLFFLEFISLLHFYM